MEPAKIVQTKYQHINLGSGDFPESSTSPTKHETYVKIYGKISNVDVT